MLTMFHHDRITHVIILFMGGYIVALCVNLVAGFKYVNINTDLNLCLRKYFIPLNVFCHYVFSPSSLLYYYYTITTDKSCSPLITTILFSDYNTSVLLSVVSSPTNTTQRLLSYSHVIHTTLLWPPYRLTAGTRCHGNISWPHRDRTVGSLFSHRTPCYSYPSSVVRPSTLSLPRNPTNLWLTSTTDW